MIIAFLSLIVYLTWFQIFEAETVKNNNYNKRQWINEEIIMRGSITDRNGLELARSVRDEGSQITRRIYDYNNLYSHIIGYSYREYGKTGMEQKYNKVLLDIEESSTINEIKKMLDEDKVGNSIRTTLDHELQKKARELIDGKKGAMVVMNPKTGEIYAMVSYPDFEVSNLKDNWQSITENPDSPLLNRATQGVYEPGSTFKIITATALMNNKDISQDYYCKGTTLVDGYTFKDYSRRGHGNTDLNKAIIKSCNNYFIDKTLEIGKNRFGKTAEKFLINQEIPLETNVAKSQFDFRREMGKTELAASGIGQGKVLMTPLNMALATSAIVNKGSLVKPTLIKEVVNKDGDIIDRHRPKEISRVLSEENALLLTEYMGNVVRQGTGGRARIKDINVGGKTGTAENASGNSHAWFVGFAPVEDPSLVVSIIVEEAGQGGRVAAPIAKEIIEYGIKERGL